MANAPVLVNFVDYEKAFDSLDRDTLWKLLRHYGIPDKIITLIRNTYGGMTYIRLLMLADLLSPSK